MRVPNWKKAVVDRRKLQEYLLSPTHPVGRFKAHYFEALGYEATDWEVLEADLIATLDSDAAEAIGRKLRGQGSYGVREVTGSGREMRINTRLG